MLRCPNFAFGSTTYFDLQHETFHSFLDPDAHECHGIDARQCNNRQQREELGAQKHHCQADNPFQGWPDADALFQETR